MVALAVTISTAPPNRHGWRATTWWGNSHDAKTIIARESIRQVLMLITATSTVMTKGEPRLTTD
jgi:hypothetical protein